MKEWVEFESCNGKTIDRIDIQDDEQWALTFTDGTWSTINAKAVAYSEDMVELLSKRPGKNPRELIPVMDRLGLDTTEMKQQLEDESKVRAERLEASERAHFERLQAKYGKGET